MCSTFWDVFSCTFIQFGAKSVLADGFGTSLQDASNTCWVWNQTLTFAVDGVARPVTFVKRLADVGEEGVIIFSGSGVGGCDEQNDQDEGSLHGSVKKVSLVKDSFRLAAIYC